ncbi:hypothetical protein JOM56_001126 [Amanita muscaria]
MKTDTTHTYLDGVPPFMDWYCGLWKLPIARRPCPQGGATVCMGFGPCTVSIFSSPAIAVSGWAGHLFFWSHRSPNPNPRYCT